MTTKSRHPETVALHGGNFRSDATTNAVAVPIYQTTSYEFNSCEHASNLFALKELGNIYSRIMNPTNAVLEERVAALEGGMAAVALSSGQAASAFSIQNVARAGDNIVCSTDIYGGTWNLFNNTLRALGIDVRFADPSNPDNFKKEFKQAGITQFGSGWCWLSIDNGKLVISKTANAANPLVDKMKPILGCDVWEHSYYIDYRNRRPEYLDKFMDKLVNWEFVESQLD